MSFDLLAPHYRWLEIVLAGRKLHRCRTFFLPEIPAPRNILLLGEGHGRGLMECRWRWPRARITCLDASAPMLLQARRRLDSLGPLSGPSVEFIHADVLAWRPVPCTYDLLVSNFFLDCFRSDQLERVIPQLAAAATADASWLIADFQTAPRGWKRRRSQVILWAMYAFFRVVTRLPAKRLVPPASFLERSGFSLHRRNETEWGLLYSDWWKRCSS
jgi:ubiquinone/menaquinone biosynthesis C-methylase UbiE